MPRYTQTPPVPPTEGGFGSLKNWLAGGVRVGSGLLSSEGMLPGALISGAGEGIAELIEDPTTMPSWKRMAVESGIGAIPLGKVFEAGKVVSSALKSGALSGVGETGREVAKGEELNPRAIATATGIGGLTGGVLSKFFGMGGPTVAEKLGPEFEVVPTAQTGRGTGTLRAGKKGGLEPVTQPRKIKSTEAPVVPDQIRPTRSTEIPYRMGEPTKLSNLNEPQLTQPSINPSQSERGVPYSTRGPAPYRASAKAAVKEDLAAREARKAARLRIGLEPNEPTVTESFGGDIKGGGTRRATIRYTSPRDEDAADAIAMGTAGAKSKIPIKSKSSVSSTPKGEPLPSESPLGKILKPKKSRSIKTTEGFQEQVDKILGEPTKIKAPEVVDVQPKSTPVPVTTPPPVSKGGLYDTQPEVQAEADRLGEAYRSGDKLAGRQLAELRDFMSGNKMRESWKGIAPTEQAVPDWVKEQSSIADRLKALQEGESGEINPALLRLLTGVTGAAIGAPIGAANANENDKLEGALTGGLVGGGLGLAGPSVINAIQNPELIGEGLKKFGHTLPSIQRANLLLSGHGLPANAVAGPYGSAVMGSIEHALSGDPRGVEALKHLNPLTFIQNLPENFNEARGLIGRAEGTSLNMAPTKSEKLLAYPGTMMTTGDLTARKALEVGGGFSPAETREMTMTNEPWTVAAKRLANLSKGSPLLQFMFPFSRTTANIAEQGAKRIPGLGFLVSNAMEKGGSVPDSLRAKLVQQGMGAATMGGAGLLGANIEDPETSKIVKRYVSNAAGQYSLPASIGYSAGQAYARGKPAVSGGLSELADALPLPSTRPIQDIFHAATDLGDFFSGEKDLNQVRVPHSLYPAFIRDFSTDEVKDEFNTLIPPALPKGRYGR